MTDDVMTTGSPPLKETILLTLATELGARFGLKPEIKRETGIWHSHITVSNFPEVVVIVKNEYVIVDCNGLAAHIDYDHPEMLEILIAAVAKGLHQK